MHAAMHYFPHTASLLQMRTFAMQQMDSMFIFKSTKLNAVVGNYRRIVITSESVTNGLLSRRHCAISSFEALC